MSYRKRTLEELNVLDDFLFNALASDGEVGVPFCQTLLSILLQRNVGRIRIVAQHVIPALTPEHRGIRMDVKVEEFEDGKDGEEESVLNIYDLEPHLQREENLARHNRFYQAKIDSRYMSSGEDDFSRLPNLYVITLTNFDPFGQNYMMYTIQNGCRELPDLEYDDGVRFIYFYTGGEKGGSPELRELLRYLQNSTEQNVTNETIRKIHGFVSQVKVLPEVKQEYMTFEHFVAMKERAAAREAAIETERAVLSGMVLAFLRDLGTVPEELEKQILEEMDSAKLKSWCHLAAKAGSVEEFREQMKEA